jgi:hypothetical protein
MAQGMGDAMRVAEMTTGKAGVAFMIEGLTLNHQQNGSGYHHRG